MVLVHAFYFAFFVLVALVIAWRLASHFLPRAPTGVFLLAVGLLLQAVPALFVLLLGLCGGFHLGPAMVVSAFAAAFVQWQFPRWRSCSELFSHLAFSRGYSVTTAAVAWLGFGAFLIVVLNQLRYTVIDADSLWYHLVMPAEWVRTGSTWPADVVPTMAKGYPGFRQATIAWLSLPFGNEHLALMGLFEYPMLALATYVLAREFGSSRSLAMAVGVAGASTPVALAALSTQGNDLALGIYLASSIAFCLRFFRNGRRPDGVLAGIALAALAATKFSGPAYCALVLATCAVQAGARPLLSRRSLVAIAVPPLMLAAPWYVRNWVHFGNPLWPAKLEVAGMVLPGPLDRAFFTSQTMGFDLEPLFANLGFFVDAHGWLIPLVVAAPLLLLAACLAGKCSWRTSFVAIVLPVLLFVMWLKHPFNLPRFDANYSHRYLIAWCLVGFASTAAALTAWLPRVSLAPVFGLSAVLGFAAISSLIWPVVALAIVLALAPRPGLVRDAFHGAWNVLCELRVPAAVAAIALWLAAGGVQSQRIRWQYSEAVGYRDGSSERGWGACVGFVHREIANKRVGLHGNHFFFPLIGEKWSNEVVLADEPLLEVAPKTPAQVFAWVAEERLEYLVCCRDRTRGEDGQWVFAESVASYLLTRAPERFEVVFEDQGAHVLRCRR